MPPVTIAVLSQKGGTGKTTTVRTLTDVFRRVGLSVLAVDLDPQGNLSDYLDVDPDASPTIGDVLSGRAKAREAIHDGIIPANLGLAESELALGGKMGRELTLKKALREVAGDYDIVLIDCPPALGLLTVNALVASDYALLSAEAQYFALQGVEQALEVIELARDSLNPDLEWLGVVLNIADMRTRHSREAFDSLRQHFGDKLIETTIRSSIAYAESAERAVSILDYRPDLAVDYLDVADELLKRLGRDDARKPLRQLRRAARARVGRRGPRLTGFGPRPNVALTLGGETGGVTTESAAAPASAPSPLTPLPRARAGDPGRAHVRADPDQDQHDLQRAARPPAVPARAGHPHPGGGAGGARAGGAPVVVGAGTACGSPSWRWSALGALNLTMGAGKALREDLGVPIAGFGGASGPGALIARHEHAADLLRIFTILFTAVLIVSLALFREDGGAPVTGIGFVDGLVVRLRSTPAVLVLARVAMAVLAVLCLYFVFHTGDLGAKAVWQGRIHSGGGFGGAPGGGGGVGSLFGPGSGGGSGGGGGGWAAGRRPGPAGQSSRTSAPWDSNGARRTSAQPSAARLRRSITAPVCS